MQSLLDTLDISPLSSAAPFELYFEVTVPNLGYRSVVLTPRNSTSSDYSGALDSSYSSGDMHDMSSYAVAQTFVPMPEGSIEHVCATCEAAAAFSKDSDAYKMHESPSKAISGSAVLENEHLKVVLDGMTGKVVGIVQKKSGVFVGVTMQLIFWESKKEAPYGGAYIMRPGPQVCHHACRLRSAVACMQSTFVSFLHSTGRSLLGC